MLIPMALLRIFGVRIPYALSLQEDDASEPLLTHWMFYPLRLLIRYGLRHASVVQAVSGYLAELAQGYGYSGRVEVIPNGATIEQFANVTNSPQNKCADLGVGEDDVCLIATSPLVKKNAIDVCIRALALMPPSVHFIVAGGGPEAAALRRLADELGVRERVHFVGHLHRDDMPLYLCACDIFVRPSRSRGMGSSFVEAMAAGLPVIATQTGGIRDFLFDEKRNPDKAPTGWAVDIDAPEQIAEAVADICNRPAHTKRVVAHAQKIITTTFNWDRIAEAMRERVFVRILK
jgi:glycosyltransferase involved in cell wall biosynthesis